MNKYIVEYGHYYKNQWPTLGTKQSISIFETLKQNWYFWEDIFTILFVDDVHPINPHEPESENFSIDFKALYFNLTIFESRTKVAASQLIDSLQKDPDLEVFQEWPKKYLKNGGKTKIELADGKEPSCVMMDAALTRLKLSTKTWPWNNKVVINILPESYSTQQENLHKVISELFRIWVMKEPIYLQSLLFNKDLTTCKILETIHKVGEKSYFAL